MNKRITSILLCFVMLFSMLVSAVPSYAAPVNPPMIYIEADRTEASPGDTITYKFYLQQPDTMTAFAFNMVAPNGLTYVEGSGKLGSTASAAWGSTFEWVPEADLQLQWYSSSGDDVTDTSKIELITIQFKVAADATIGAEYEMDLKNMQLAAGSTQNYDDISSTVEVTTAKVKIVAKPISVTGVTIDETMSLKTGESKDLTVTVNPADATNKEVTFSVSGDAITVDANGKVTGIKKGVSTVTVTTVDGSFSDTCTVTVACSHANKTATAEADSDCKTQGWDAYSTCDDCGQIFNEAGEEIAEIPYRPLSTQHVGGTATCTEKPICTVCGNPYGSNLGHDFISREIKDAALKTVGDCGKEAVYIMSCTRCHVVDTDTTNTFPGEKDPENHANYGTYLDQAAEPDHKNGVDGYTGDKRCNSCKKILENGQPIAAGAHVPANVWSTDSTHHWKECTVTGCGIVIDGSKAEHKSEKAENKAACEKQAVCDVCGIAYGEIPTHEFTKEAKKDAALKTVGDCGKEAVYIMSCVYCDAVDTDTTNTFLGEKDPENHANYGTYLDQAAAPDHKNGVDGYTGDKRCNSCKKILENGQPIPAGAHVPSDDWSTNSTHHWKECTVTGCGIVIDGSRAEHKSEKAENKAACGKQAVCDVCGIAYGNPMSHSFTKEAKKDAALKTAGDCGQEAIYVKSCVHCDAVDTDTTNTFKGEKNPANHANYGTKLVGVVEVDHKIAKDGYTGDKHCNKCDALLEKGQSIPAGAHVPADDWSTNSTHHWKECTVTGCGIVIDGSKAEHKSEKAENKAACEKQAVCDVCGIGYGETPEHKYGDEKPEVPAEIGKTGLEAHYQCSECQKYFVDVEHDTHVEKKEVAYEDLIIPALVDNELTIEIPFSVVVKKTGDLDPTKETFTFKMFDLGYEDAVYTVDGLTVETNGVNTYTGKLIIKVKESQFGNLSEGFKFAQVKGTSDGWTYDETVYYLAPQVFDTGVISFIIFPGDDGWGETTLEKVEFTNSYNKAKEPAQPEAPKPSEDDKPEAPKPSEDNKPSDNPLTGYNSMMWLCILLFVSGCGVVATSVLGQKRRSVR